MSLPADDVDLAVAASYAHAHLRALVTITSRLERPPTGVHTAADKLAAWILDLDPDEERFKRAARLMADSEWLELRVDKALELLVGRLEAHAYAEQFRPVLPHLRDALARIRRIIGLMEPPGATRPPRPAGAQPGSRNRAARPRAGAGKRAGSVDDLIDKLLGASDE